MPTIDNIIEKAFDDTDMNLESIPKLDLYMDQILTLFDNELPSSGRLNDEKALTKTMINNYSKERLILPIQGKKYSRKQIMQLLCIVNLKQNMSLADIRPLIAQSNTEDDIDLGVAYERSLGLKSDLKVGLKSLLSEVLDPETDLSGQQNALMLTLALSSAASYFKSICENIVDNITSLDSDQ